MDKPTLSHKLDLAHLPDIALRHPITLIASQAQRETLAGALGILAIDSLTGRFKLQRDREGVIQAQLDLKAQVMQACVVTLDPIGQAIAERAPLTLLTEAQAAARNTDADLIDPDAPDPIIADGTVIDLGGLLTEQLALALDPYPRKPDAALAPGPTAPHPGPFAKLADRN